MSSNLPHNNPSIPEESLTTAEKLNLETAVLKWKDLALFFAKGTLLRVDESQDLIEVATYIADNNQTALKPLITNKLIEFATAEWVKENTYEDKEFWTLVVAPYVICQPVKAEPSH